MHRIRSFYPTLGQSWVVVAVFLSATLGISFMISTVAALFGGAMIPGSWVTLAAYTVPFVFVAGFIYWLPSGLRLSAAPDAPVTSDVRRKLSPMLFVWLLLLAPLLSILTEPLTMWIPMPEYMKEMFGRLFQRDAVTLLMVAVAAPVCEEWMCRGVIAKGLLRHSTPGKAIVWSAFIFALIHLNPWQALPAFVFGLFLGYVYWKTQSLWPCIFIHFVINGLSFLLLFLFPEMDVNASMREIAGADYWKLYVMAALAAVYVGYLVKRLLGD